MISELEARIGVLRAERDAADLVVDQPDVNVTPPGTPQPAPERPADEPPIGPHDTRLALNRQIEEAITALEAIRVDLLRIRSGVGTHDDLKSGLTVPRQIAALGRARPILSAATDQTSSPMSSFE